MNDVPAADPRPGQVPIGPADPHIEASASRWAWTLLLASLVVLAVAIPSYRARSSARSQDRLITAVPTGGAVRRCNIGVAHCAAGAVRPSALVAIISRFHDARVRHSYALSDDGGIDTEFVDLRTPAGIAVSVRSRCTGGGGSVPDRTYGDTAAVGPVRLVIVAGGRNGCSVAVALDVPPGVAVPAIAATTLAHDAILALPP